MLSGAPAFLLYAAPAKAGQAWDFLWSRPLVATAALTLAFATLAGFFLQTVAMSGSLDNTRAPGTLSYVVASTVKTLRTSVFTETLLAVAVLAIVGVLGVLTPISAQ